MGITDPINNLLEFLLGWIFNFGDLISVLILSFLVTLFITIIYKYTTNQNHLKEIKQKQKQYQKEMKELKDNPQEMMKKQKEAMSLTGQYMKHSMKPMLYTFLPIIIIFGWMRGHYGSEKILNLYLFKLGWLGTYIIFSIIFSTLIRKFLKVH